MQSFNKRYWPHQFRLQPEMDAWEQVSRLEAYCIDNFEPGAWRNNGLYFGFKREADAAFFMLRWGG